MRFGPRHLALVMASALLLAGCGGGPPDANEGDYVQQLLKARVAKDAEFRNSPGEPVPRDELLWRRR